MRDHARLRRTQVGMPVSGLDEYSALVPTLRDVLSQATTVPPADAEWLRRLAGDWQMVADLSFSDLTLWIPTGPDPTPGSSQGTGDRCGSPESGGWVLAAHARPSTGPNFYSDDVVGRRASRRRQAVLESVRDAGLPMTPEVPGHVREQYVPVVRAGRAIAVLVRHADLQTMRQQGGLEVNYLQIAQALLTMVGQGAFPTEIAPTGVGRGTPRVGDGVLRLDADGRIEYASPNAVSALRRLGHTEHVGGADLSQIVTQHLPSGTVLDETVPLVLTGRAPWGAEIEAQSLINLTLRAVPLFRNRQRVGALLLMRDVSELRRRERELLTKDATIREIHHRVKNNLQTVAALLRLQSRRMEDPGAKAALQEAGRRLTTVALVHDTLSHTFEEVVEFDEIAVRIVRATIEVASRGVSVTPSHTGSFGRMSAEDATPMAMILAEVVHNAVEHGFDAEKFDSGTVHVDAARYRLPSIDSDGAGDLTPVGLSGRHHDVGGAEVLEVTVRDDGRGLPDGQAPARTGLGMQIVEALARDLHGEIAWETAKPHGTVVRMRMRLRG